MSIGARPSRGWDRAAAAPSGFPSPDVNSVARSDVRAPGGSAAGQRTAGRARRRHGGIAGTGEQERYGRRRDQREASARLEKRAPRVDHLSSSAGCVSVRDSPIIDLADKIHCLWNDRRLAPDPVMDVWSMSDMRLSAAASAQRRRTCCSYAGTQARMKSDRRSAPGSLKPTSVTLSLASKSIFVFAPSKVIIIWVRLWNP